VRKLLLALTGLLALAAVPAAAQTASWPMVQGGPEHHGVAVGAPDPPYRIDWEIEAGESGHRGASGPVVVGDLAIAVGRDEVFAADTRTGAIRWTVARAPDPPVVPAVDEDGATLVYPEGTGDARAVIGLDLATLAVRWRFKPDAEVRSAPAADGNTFYVASRIGTISALDARTGTERWSFDADGTVFGPIAVSDGVVYVAAEDTVSFETTVYAIDAADGAQRWQFKPQRRGVFASGPAVDGERVFLGFGDGSVRALGISNGSPVWTRTLALGQGFGPGSAPALVEGDLLVASRDGSVSRLDGATGERRWRFRAPGGFVQSSPLVVGDSVVAGSADGFIVALDLETGRRVWQLDLRGGPIGAIAPAGDRLLVGLGATEGGLVALEHDAEGELTSVESPTVLKPVVAVGNFAIAFVALTGGLLLGSRLIRRARPATRSDGGRDDPEVAAPDGDDPPPGGYR
jgi:outer membrane protein assembly factor BamB